MQGLRHIKKLASRNTAPLLKLNVRTQPSLKPDTSRLSDPSKRIAVTATGSSVPSGRRRMRATNWITCSPVSAFHTEMTDASSALTTNQSVTAVVYAMGAFFHLPLSLLFPSPSTPSLPFPSIYSFIYFTEHRQLQYEQSTSISVP